MLIVIATREIKSELRPFNCFQLTVIFKVISQSFYSASILVSLSLYWRWTKQSLGEVLYYHFNHWVRVCANLEKAAREKFVVSTVAYIRFISDFTNEN